MKCPVCDSDMHTPLCSCGYDASRDYGKYPTFGQLPNLSSHAVAADTLQCPSCSCRTFSFLLATDSFVCTRCHREIPRIPPSSLSTPSFISAIAAGSSYCAVLYSDETVRIHDKNSHFTWFEPNWDHICSIYPGQKHFYGKNTDGIMLQLPLNTLHCKDLVSCSQHFRHLVKEHVKINIENSFSNIPVCVSEHPHLKAVAEGPFHTLCLLANGRIFRKRGDEHLARCQTDHWTDVIAIATSSEHSFGLTTNGNVLVAGDLRRKISRVQQWCNIAAIATGNDHVIGLCKDGTVSAAGNNDSGQCDVRGWYDIVAVAAGHSHTVGLRKNGSSIAIGDNTSNQCDVTHWRNIIAIAAGNSFTVGLKKDGTLVCTDAKIEEAFRTMK